MIEQELQYRAIFEASSDGLVITDLESELVIEANPAFCRMHGYERMDGLHPSVFIHPSSHHLFTAYIETVKEGRVFRANAQDIRLDGTIFDVEVIGRSFLYRGKPAVLGVVRDVTEHVRAYHDLEQHVAERTREIERRREVAEGLRDLLAIVNSTRTLDEILEYIVKQSCSLLGSDASAIFLPSDGPDGEVLTIRASNGLEEEYAAVRLPIGMSSTGLAYSRRWPVAVPDVRAALPSLSNPNLELEEHPSHSVVLRLPAVLDTSETNALARLQAFATGYGALLVVPLAVKDERYGALASYFREPRQFDADDVALASAFADQTALVLENARLRDQAERTAVLEERQRLARDLHDAVTQTLFSATLIADVIPELWSTDPSEAERRLNQLRRLTRGALAEMRLLLIELRPGALTDLSLNDLLRQLTDAAAGNTGAEVSVRVEGPGPLRVPSDVQIAFYRIAQEALNNVVKHARATTIDVLMRCHADGGVMLEIRDDGRGFDPGFCPPGHLGLSIMRERAEEAGAEFRLESTPGVGTRIQAIWRNEEEPVS